MKRMGMKVFSLAMAIVLVLGALPATAETPKAQKLATLGSTDMQFNNNTGASITEVYLYPNYSSSLGAARNKGWIYAQNSGVISITAAEARRNCLWNMKIMFKPGNGRAFSVTWEDIDLQSYLGRVVEIKVNDNGTYNMSVVNQSSNIGFTFYNDLGYTISEIYFYPANSSTWGQMRNNRALADQGSIYINFNSTESTSSARWCMRIQLQISGSWYYVEFDDVDLNYYNGSTMVLTINYSGNVEMYRYDGSI